MSGRSGDGRSLKYIHCWEYRRGSGLAASGALWIRPGASGRKGRQDRRYRGSPMIGVAVSELAGTAILSSDRIHQAMTQTAEKLTVYLSE